MAVYVAKRLGYSIILFWIVTLITFTIIRQAPGGTAILANPDLTREQIAALTESMGFNDPIHIQYGRWLADLATFNFGISFNEGVPVASLIGARLPATLLLSSVALVIAIVGGIGLGILSALNRNSWIDGVASAVGTLNLSIPTFWLGIVLILFFAVELRWLPVGGWPRGRDPGMIEIARHLVLPATVASGFLMANVMRYTRSSFLDVSNQLYVTAARSMGLRERRIVFVYVLKNAMLPIVTIIGLGLPQLFAGAAITETVFSWPGIGSLGVVAARTGDYPLIMGITLVVSLIVILANLLTDISYTLLDPRVRLS